MEIVDMKQGCFSNVMHVWTL